MANLYKNKVVYGGDTLIDLSGDTVTSPAHIVSGRIGHLADGSQVAGTGVVPSGTIQITENGTVDVTNYASAEVNVSGTDQTLQAFMQRTLTDYEDDFTTGNIPGRAINGAFPNLTRIRMNNATGFGGQPYYQFVVTGRSDLVIVLPKCRNTSINCCNGCTSLKTFDFLGSTSGKINQQMFYGCTNLDTLIIRTTAGVMPLSNVNAFTNSKFGSGKAGGTIYVPSALIASYQAATNWSTLDGYGTVTWSAIEGSQYENYYADGTAVTS